MTKKKRKHKNWMEARANCTRQGVFDRIVDAVGSDIKKYSSFAKRKKKAIQFCAVPFAHDKHIVRPNTADQMDAYNDDYVVIHL